MPQTYILLHLSSNYLPAEDPMLCIGLADVLAMPEAHSLLTPARRYHKTEPPRQSDNVSCE